MEGWSWVTQTQDLSGASIYCFLASGFTSSFPFPSASVWTPWVFQQTFSGAQAMWPVCSPGARRGCMLSRTGLLEWSEKKQMGRPHAGL